MTNTPAPAEATIGHNNPPTLAERLATDYADIIALRDAAKRALEAVPAELKTDEDLELARAAITGATEAAKKAELKRTVEVADLNEQTKVINVFFNKGVRDELAPLKQAVSQRAADLLEERRQAALKKAAEEQAALDAEAARKADEAAALEAAGRHHEADVVMNQAVVAETRATTTGAFAGKSQADQSRVYTGGGVASSRTVRTFEITDRSKIDFAKLAPFFAVDAIEDAIRNMMRTGQEGLPGVRYFDRAKGTFR